MNEVQHSFGHRILTDIGALEQKNVLSISRKSKEQRKSIPFSLSSSATSHSTHKQITHLSKCNVSEFIIKTNVRDANQLVSNENEMHYAVQKDLYPFCEEKGQKQLSSLLKITWRILLLFYTKPIQLGKKVFSENVLMQNVMPKQFYYIYLCCSNPCHYHYW